MSAIDSLNRNKTRLEPASSFKSLRPRLCKVLLCLPYSDVLSRANSVEDAVRRGQRQVEQAKLKMSLQMDDGTFRSAILETQVSNA